IAQSAYLLIKKSYRQIILNGITIGLLYLPWIPTILMQLKNSEQMWMWPVNETLFKAVLGNLFFGYEGTPGHLWSTMQRWSALFVAIAAYLCTAKKIRSQVTLVYVWLIVPVFLVLGISLIKPIFVLRYLIYTTIAEVLLVSTFIFIIKNQRVQKVLTIVIMLGLLFTNYYVVDFHRKVPLQTTFNEIAARVTSNDVIYADGPLIYYESRYYAPKNVPVFLYNPDKIVMPAFVGGVGMPQETWAVAFPNLPQRAFLVHEDGSYEVKSKEL
ncbi:hypothetical protein C4579_00250, partial [Candidatus Microgenomates bacterium]